MTVKLVGPFDVHEVVVTGRKVPFLTATPENGGKVVLHLDHRFALDLDVADLERVVSFIAHAIAVASGFTSHPTADDEPRPLNPFTVMRGL